MSALQATLARFEAEAAKMAALKKDIAASRSGKPPPAKKARKAGPGQRPVRSVFMPVSQSSPPLSFSNPAEGAPAAFSRMTT